MVRAWEADPSQQEGPALAHTTWKPRRTSFVLMSHPRNPACAVMQGLSAYRGICFRASVASPNCQPAANAILACSTPDMQRRPLCLRVYKVQPSQTHCGQQLQQDDGASRRCVDASKQRHLPSGILGRCRKQRGLQEPEPAAGDVVQDEVHTDQLQVARLEDEGEPLQRHRELSIHQSVKLDAENKGGCMSCCW